MRSVRLWREVILPGCLLARGQLSQHILCPPSTCNNPGPLRPPLAPLSHCIVRWLEAGKHEMEVTLILIQVFNGVFYLRVSLLSHFRWAAFLSELIAPSGRAGLSGGDLYSSLLQRRRHDVILTLFSSFMTKHIKLWLLTCKWGRSKAAFQVQCMMMFFFFFFLFLNWSAWRSGPDGGIIRMCCSTFWWGRRWGCLHAPAAQETHTAECRIWNKYLPNRKRLYHINAPTSKLERLLLYSL